jgi:hypothetical protein
MQDTRQENYYIQSRRNKKPGKVVTSPSLAWKQDWSSSDVMIKVIGRQLFRFCQACLSYRREERTRRRAIIAKTLQQ